MKNHKLIEICLFNRLLHTYWIYRTGTVYDIDYLYCVEWGVKLYSLTPYIRRYNFPVAKMIFIYFILYSLVIGESIRRHAAAG